MLKYFEALNFLFDDSFVCSVFRMVEKIANSPYIINFHGLIGKSRKVIFEPIRPSQRGMKSDRLSRKKYDKTPCLQTLFKIRFHFYVNH